jgi:hypothetical protein
MMKIENGILDFGGVYFHLPAGPGAMTGFGGGRQL